VRRGERRRGSEFRVYAARRSWIYRIGWRGRAERFGVPRLRGAGRLKAGLRARFAAEAKQIRIADSDEGAAKGAEAAHHAAALSKDAEMTDHRSFATADGTPDATKETQVAANDAADVAENTATAAKNAPEAASDKNTIAQNKR